jgi:hypothetical protein
MIAKRRNGRSVMGVPVSRLRLVSSQSDQIGQPGPSRPAESPESLFEQPFRSPLLFPTPLYPHDPVTRAHVNHLACVATEVAALCGLSPEGAAIIEVGAMIHGFMNLNPLDAIVDDRRPLQEADCEQI